MEYIEFVKQKSKIDKRTGFIVQDADIHPMLFPHQRDIVRWALDGWQESHGVQAEISIAANMGKIIRYLEA